MALHSSTKIHINLAKAIESLTTNKVVKVGWQEKIRYPEESGGKYVAEVAAQNEYGVPHLNIPPRPFLGPAVADNKTKWLDIIKRGAKKAILGESNILEILDDVGDEAAGDVKKAIKAVTSPPLSPYTIAARLSKLKKKEITSSLTKPLIDTGIMFATVKHAVEPE